MKADDDLYVDVPALVRRLAEERATQRSTFGVDDATAGAFIIGQVSAVFTCIGALGTRSRTGPLARKYLPGFPYS